MRNTLEDAGCWLTVPEVIVTFEDGPSKQPWPPGAPLDTRTAIQEADIELLQGYKPANILSYFAVDLYGVPLVDLTPVEADRVGEAMIELVEAWHKMSMAHLAFLIRHLRDKMQRILTHAPLSPLTKHYLYVRAHTILMGRFEAKALPHWDRPRRFPADPTEDGLGEQMRNQYARPLLTEDDAYYRARGVATSECAKHSDIVADIDRLVDKVSKRIVIASVLSNAFPTRFDDAGAYLALGPFVHQLNRDAGPLTTAASERMVQRYAASGQDTPPALGFPVPGEPE